MARLSPEHRAAKRRQVEAVSEGMVHGCLKIVLYIILIPLVLLAIVAVLGFFIGSPD